MANKGNRHAVTYGQNSLRKEEVAVEKALSQKWNLESLYEGRFRSTKLRILLDKLSETLQRLEKELKFYGSNPQETGLQLLMNLINQFQSVLSGWEEVDDYSICLYAENVATPSVQTLMEESAVLKTRLSSVELDLDKLLSKIPEELWDSLHSHTEFQPWSFYLNRRRNFMHERLPVELEKMINILSVNGIMAWEQQHDLMLSKLKIPLFFDGEKKDASIGDALHQAIHAENRSNRQAAAAAIDQVCAAEADIFAAILNRIAGFRLDVYEQRGWKNLLKETCEQNRIDEESIQAMLVSIDQNKALYHSYFERKINIGHFEKTSWFDVESPSFASRDRIAYSEAKQLICSQFHQFSEELGNFAERAFEEGWIETENRPNKAEGGFCASLPLSKQSRIFWTYRNTYQDIVTLAHELGHAYHNYILHEEPALAQQKGTSTAESASTFMENLVLDAIIQQSRSEEEKLALLEIKINEGLKYLVTVPNMFRFEQQFYEKRKNGLLSAEEISQLLVDTETGFYNGLIEEPALYKWMYISHFYDAQNPFYNIPYTIGYLFSNGIYAQAQKDGNAFPERYAALLRHSGRMTVEQLAESFLGADLTVSTFWDGAQQSLKKAIIQYLQLTEKYCLQKE